MTNRDKNKEQTQSISKPWCPYCRTSLSPDPDAGGHATCACPRCGLLVKPHYPSMREEAEAMRQDVLTLLKVQNPDSGLHERVVDGLKRELWKYLTGRNGDAFESFEAFCRDPKGLGTAPAEVAALVDLLNQRGVKLALVPASRQGQRTSRHDDEKCGAASSASTSRHDDEKSPQSAFPDGEAYPGDATLRSRPPTARKPFTPRKDTRLRTIRDGHPTVRRAWTRNLIGAVQAEKLCRLARDPDPDVEDVLNRLENLPAEAAENAKKAVRSTVKDVLSARTKEGRAALRALFKAFEPLKAIFPTGAPGVLAELAFEYWSSVPVDLDLWDRRLRLAERAQVLYERLENGDLKGDIAALEIGLLKDDTELAQAEELIARVEAELARTGTSR